MDPSTRDLVFQSIRDLEFAPAPKDKASQCAHFSVRSAWSTATLKTLYIELRLALLLKMWTNTGMVGVTLKTAGLRTQLGHRLNDFCPERIPDNDFVILDTDGLHEVAIDYCSCEPRRSHGIQLRDARFFPSGDSSPRTAVAFKMAQLADKGTVPITMRKTRVRLPDKRVPERSSSMKLMKPPPAAIIHTDGESAERRWAQANLTTGSQKEMGPGTRHKQLELTKGSDEIHTEYEWLPGLDSVYQDYLGTLKTAESETVADASEASMDLGYVDVDDEDDIREPWVINIDRPYSAGSAEEKQMQLLTNACWPRTGSHAVGPGSHIVGSRFKVGVPLEPYRFLDERTDPREFSLLEGIHMRLSCPIEEFETVARFLDSQ
ncbi:hypothetical protein B0H11DRAFT_2222275 [Mycena galericulata]|nr:hypothetical protein B0H11DRAFT_2222275 [Mycena galericulata]